MVGSSICVIVLYNSHSIVRCLLLSIGISGFLLQVLLTEGLQREKAGRATNLIVCIEPTPLIARLPNLSSSIPS